jgi:hypothetical protein
MTNASDKTATKQNESKVMNDKFDELANGLAHSATRGGALKKFGVGLAGIALSIFGLLCWLRADSQALADHGPAEAPRPEAMAKQAAPGLPPLPAGVTELKFDEFFVSPVGERGLVLTEKLRGLDGKRVRILGYMVRQEEATSGKFLFAPLPVEVHEHDSQFADDLPPSTVHVFVPTCRDQPVPYTRQLLLLTGTLSVGNREEADGRISLVRLALDPPPRATTRKFSFTEKGATRLVRNP